VNEIQNEVIQNKINNIENNVKRHVVNIRLHGMATNGRVLDVIVSPKISDMFNFS
jgi:hypothetical protein